MQAAGPPAPRQSDLVWRGVFGDSVGVFYKTDTSAHGSHEGGCRGRGVVGPRIVEGAEEERTVTTEKDKSDDKEAKTRYVQ